MVLPSTIKFTIFIYINDYLANSYKKFSILYIVYLIIISIVSLNSTMVNLYNYYYFFKLSTYT